MVRLTDRPDMILDVYSGRKTTMQQQVSQLLTLLHSEWPKFFGVLAILSAIVLNKINFRRYLCLVVLAHEAPTTTAADDIYKKTFSLLIRENKT